MTTVVGGTAREIGEAPRRRHFSLPRSLATHDSEVALETSHLDKSALKLDFDWKSWERLSTPETSQSLMLP